MHRLEEGEVGRPSVSMKTPFDVLGLHLLHDRAAVTLTGPRGRVAQPG